MTEKSIKQTMKFVEYFTPTDDNLVATVWSTTHKVSVGQILKEDALFVYRDSFKNYVMAFDELSVLKGQLRLQEHLLLEKAAQIREYLDSRQLQKKEKEKEQQQEVDRALQQG